MASLFIHYFTDRNAGIKITQVAILIFRTTEATCLTEYFVKFGTKAFVGRSTFDDF